MNNVLFPLWTNNFRIFQQVNLRKIKYAFTILFSTGILTLWGKSVVLAEEKKKPILFY